MRIPTSTLVLTVLKMQKLPATVPMIMLSLKRNPPSSTVSRALRRMRAKGIVTSERNGSRWVLWSLKQIQPAKVQVSKQQAKGPARRNIMCRPDNMPTLCKAIDEQVALFITDKKEFSAFEVTKALREKVAKAAIARTDAGIDDVETGTVFVAGVSVAKIDHEVVKEAVHDLFQRGEMTGFDRTYNGNHWLYAVEQVTDDDVDDVDSVDPIGATPGTVPGTVSGAGYDGNSSL